MSARRRSGANHTEAEAPDLIAHGMLGRCESTGQTFHVGRVEVLARYADCSVFKCPSCGGSHDDRPSWGGSRDRRMGYSVVRAPDVDRWGVMP